MNTASILGVQFHAVTKQQAVELAMSKIRSRQKGYVVTPNPEIVDLCRHDEKFMGVVNHATLVLPDGIGIIYAAKILGEKLHGKVAGIEFAEKYGARGHFRDHAALTFRVERCDLSGVFARMAGNRHDGEVARVESRE